MSALKGPVWLAVREYAGLAEAGGVKNVTRSQAEALARLGESVTVFMPGYGFIEETGIELFTLTIDVNDESYEVTFTSLDLEGVRIILALSRLYAGKHQVYVYTEDEASRIPGARRGSGHLDVDVMNILLQKAVIAYAQHTGESPAVVHCHDAHTALLPALARSDSRASALFSETAFFVTVHNAGPGYRQTLCDAEYAVALTGLDRQTLENGRIGNRIEPFLIAASSAVLTTVSPWYAEELTAPLFDSHTEGLSAELRRRGVHVEGITNGIDRFRYCPRYPGQSLLPFAFNPAEGELSGKYRCREAFIEKIASGSLPEGIVKAGSLLDSEDAVWFCYQGRIAHQKGLSVLADAVRSLLEREPLARFMVMGQGAPELEHSFEELCWAYPGRFLLLQGYERALARLVVASSDFLILPSEYEPCGLEDYIAQIFGTIPVARAVGGLNKIRNGETGFLYGSDSRPNDPRELADIMSRLTEEWSSRSRGAAESPFLVMIRQASLYVAREADWDRIIRESYLPLYEKKVQPWY